MLLISLRLLRGAYSSCFVCLRRTCRCRLLLVSSCLFCRGLGGMRTMRGHADDILSMVYCPPSLLCTGSAGGEIISWNLSACRIKARMRVPLARRPPSHPPAATALSVSPPRMEV